MSKQFVFTAIGGPEHQKLIDVPAPQPRPGQLAVKVRAAGVNPVDWKLRTGYLGKDLAVPHPLGTEVAGTVTALGEGVEDFAIGDDVLGPVAPGYGGFAQDTILDASSAVAKPEEISFVDAATLPVAGATAYDGTHQIELEKGQVLLILGAGGGVGLMAAQIGRVHQFAVIGVASESKREVVEETGATFIASGPGVVDRARGAAPGGVDLILDLVGGDALRELAPLAQDPATIISAADGPTAEELGGSKLVRTVEALEKITGVVEYNLVDPHVSALYPLDKAADALAAVENGHATGKIVLEMR